MSDWLPLPSCLTGIVMEKVKKKRLFGGAYVRFPEFITGCAMLFSEGAVIGRAKRDTFDLLAYALFDYERANRNLGVATDPSWLKSWLQDHATKNLERYQNICGELPTAFGQFVSVLMYRDRGAVYPCNQYHLLTMPPAESDQNFQSINKLLGSKVSAETADLEMSEWCAIGFGFGFKYPDLTKRLYEGENSYDSDKWTHYRDAGLPVPESSMMPSLSEFEDQMFKLMVIYAAMYYPAMLQALGLEVYLPESVSL